jgi:hypothetical protein
MKTIVTTLLCCLSTIVWGQKKETLVLNLKKDVTYAQTSLVANTISQSIMGQPIDIKVDTRSDLQFRVTAASATHYDIEMTYKSITVTAHSPMGSQTLSSENADDANPTARFLASIKGKSLTIKIDKHGKVLEISDIPDLLSSIALLPPEQQQQFRAMFDEATLRQNLETSLPLFPEHPVAVGDTWTRDFTVPSMGISLKASMTYTFHGTENGQWKITGEGTLQVPDKETYVNINGVDMKCDIGGPLTYDFNLDKATGWTTSGKATLTLQGTLHAKGNERLPNGMTVEVKANAISTVTSEIVK